MKKLFVVAVIALLALALVACGGEETATTKGADTTAAPTTTASPATGAPTTTESPATTAVLYTTVTPDTTTTPETTAGDPAYADAIDLLFEEGYMAIGDMGSAFFAFEDFHASLDNNVALVISMNDQGGVYNDLFIIDTENENTNTNWEPNMDYTWIVTIEGRQWEISRFSLFNNTTSGWVRIDLGPDFKWSLFEYDKNGEYTYEQVRIDIYDSKKNVVYFADLTTDALWGGYTHKKPDEKVMIPDANRPANLVVVEPSMATPLSGPDSGNGEDFRKFFDGKVETKICTGDNGEEKAITVKYSEVLNVVGFSIVNANDNANSNGRTIVSFKLYGSATGEDGTWTEVYVADGTDGAGNAIDKSTISANYKERFYALNGVASYQYFKFVAENGEMWQASELLFYQEP